MPQFKRAEGSSHSRVFQEAILSFSRPLILFSLVFRSGFL